MKRTGTRAKRFTRGIRSVLATVSLLIAPWAFGQEAADPAANDRAEIKKLDFMVGDWQGRGWVQRGDQRLEFTLSETVQLKLNGAILYIEGVDRAPAPGEPIVYSGAAVISWDREAKLYRLHHWGSDGSYEPAEGARLEGGALKWQYRSATLGIVRVTIRLNDKGEWFEVGERSAGGGMWQKQFEITTRRKETPSR